MQPWEIEVPVDSTSTIHRTPLLLISPYEIDLIETRYLAMDLSQTIEDCETLQQDHEQW